MVFRVLDQALWSGAFFLFNGLALAGLTTSGFAELAVATAVAFIAISINRSYSLTAGVVVAARHDVRSTQSVVPRRVVTSTGFLAVVASGVVLGVIYLSDGHTSLAVAVLPGFFVVSDVGRQVFVVIGRYGWACGQSSLYFALACAALGIHHYSNVNPMVVWAVVLVVVTAFSVVSLVLAARDTTWQRRPLTGTRNVALPFALEAMYFGVAGQVGLLLLYGLGDEDSAAALRVSYSLVFAPAFAVIQSLAPLVVRRLSDAKVGGTLERRPFQKIVAIWSGVIFGLAGASAVASVIWIPYFDSVQASDLAPYLAPVGLMLATSQVVETLVTARRILNRGRHLHLERTVLATVDVLLQVSATVLWGVPGLVAALWLLGASRVLISLRHYHQM
jgi:hypothetical protein